MTLSRVRVHHPLKQGLRHHIICLKFLLLCHVRVHHPLKQGLRHRGEYILYDL